MRPENNEPESESRETASVVGFDESWYRKTYPDIDAAIENGVIPSGLFHYERFGRVEGRMPCRFEAQWYAMVYPTATLEAGSSDPIALVRHYLDVGRYRGYLPYASSRRPAFAAQIPRAFGGLWIDHANALDLIDGKRAIGRIDADEAELLRFFVTNGYVKLPEPLAPSIVDRAEEALEAAYAGEVGGLLFECHAISPVHCAWDPRLRDFAAKALDLHWWSEAIRDAAFAAPVVDFLQLIFERPPLASQTLSFYRGSGQNFHQDSAYVPYSLPLQFAASWIGLEDVAVGAGELMYAVGSHRVLPEYLYPGKLRSVAEFARLGADAASVSEAVRGHEAQIAAEIHSRGLKRDTFLAKRGEVLLWHADLAHGGSPISYARSRKSLVTHYCPAEVAPIYFETNPSDIRRHGETASYASGIYGDRAKKFAA
jgi:hypothetical protein